MRRTARTNFQSAESDEGAHRRADGHAVCRRLRSFGILTLAAHDIRLHPGARDDRRRRRIRHHADLFFLARRLDASHRECVSACRIRHAGRTSIRFGALPALSRRERIFRRVVVSCAASLRNRPGCRRIWRNLRNNGRDCAFRIYARSATGGRKGAVRGRHTTRNRIPLRCRNCRSNRQAMFFLLAWLAVNVLLGAFPQAVGVSSAIAWEAHVGGFLFGLLFFSFFDRAGRHALSSQ